MRQKVCVCLSEIEIESGAKSRELKVLFFTLRETL